MSSAPLLLSDPASESGGPTGLAKRKAPRGLHRRPHVLPYTATVVARTQRTPANWKGTILVGAVAALLVAAAVATAVTR